MENPSGGAAGSGGFRKCNPVDALAEHRHSTAVMFADEPRQSHMQSGAIPHHRQVGQDASDVIAELAGVPAGRAHRIFDNGSAVDVGHRLLDGGAGDGDTEFDGSADGIGDKVSSLVHGSCGVFGFGAGTFILTSQDPLHASTSCVSSDHRRIGLMHSGSGRAFKLGTPLLFENDFHLAEASGWLLDLTVQTRRMLEKWDELQS